MASNAENVSIEWRHHDDQKPVLFQHDTSIAAYLSAMKVYDDTLPPYGSFFMLELHESDQGGHFVRVHYKTDTLDDFESVPRLLEFPGTIADHDQL